MATKEAPRDAAPPSVGDIRSARPLLFGTSLTTFGRRGLSILSLVALDLIGLVLGLYAAFVLRALYYGDEILWGALWRAESEWLPFLALVMLLVFWRAGLYAERERRGGGGRIIGSLILVGLVAVVYGVGTNREFGTYGLAPTAVVLTTAFIGLLRASYDVVTEDLLHAFGVRRRAVLVGDQDRVGHLRRILGEGRSGIRYEFVGAVGPSADGMPMRFLGRISEISRVVAENEIDELIVAEADFDDRELLELVDLAHRRGVRVRLAPTTTELLTQRADYIPGQGVPLFELRPPAFVGTDWLVKRTFDLAVSGVILVVGLPIWVAIAAAIKLTSRGPVLYRDRRIGLNEQEFEMLKFRTMRHDAAALQPQLEAENEAKGALFKLKDDPRVTRVGAFLRRLSLDEVPQVLNVLRGEMSLVGPRPLPIRDYRLLEDWHRKRYRVLPGMTGLWQIAGRSDLEFDDLVRLDFYYLENWSIWLDISILLRTIPAVVAGKGAY
ncbi:MAG TPA: sugar transferase [Gaiellaceae bacterium]|nr:sugar transferase [Gaiellaceae bacterium]